MQSSPAKHTIVYPPVRVAQVRNPARVDMEVWGELAERAAAELPKGTQVQVHSLWVFAYGICVTNRMLTVGPCRLVWAGFPSSEYG